jgi:hypothetical protein
MARMRRFGDAMAVTLAKRRSLYDPRAIHISRLPTIDAEAANDR